LEGEATRQKIAVIGAGSWGTALACLLVDNGYPVTLWCRSEAQAEEMSSKRVNSRYLPSFTLPDDLSVSSDLSQVCSDHKHFLMVVPSRSFSQVLDQMVSFGVDDSSLVFSGTKGFDSENLSLLSDLILEKFGPNTKVGTVTGPSFAKEVMNKLPTALTVGANDDETSETISGFFRNSYTKVYTNDDLIGVQVGGAVKNVLAIACGISDGLGFGSNSKAALITRGLTEITRLGLALGGKQSTFQGLSGMGDLVLTCTDDKSRNRQFGLAIGSGKSIADAKLSIGQEVEGIVTSLEVFKLSHKLKVEMPICEQVYLIVHEAVSPKLAVSRLLSRKNTNE